MRTSKRAGEEEHVTCGKINKILEISLQTNA